MDASSIRVFPNQVHVVVKISEKWTSDSLFQKYIKNDKGHCFIDFFDIYPVMQCVEIFESSKHISHLNSIFVWHQLWFREGEKCTYLVTWTDRHRSSRFWHVDMMLVCNGISMCSTDKLNKYYSITIEIRIH